jgi:hypothetical protein
LTKLQQLDLADVIIHGDADVIGKLTTLQQLRLCRVRVLGERSEYDSALEVLENMAASVSTTPGHPPGTQAYVLSSEFLQQLFGLTCLDVDSCLTDAGLQHVSALTKLQRLSLGCQLQVSTEGLAGVQQLTGLTSLELSQYRCSLDTDTLPGISGLSALQRLTVSGVVLENQEPSYTPTGIEYQVCYFHPALLKGLKQLRWLELRSAALCNGPLGTDTTAF